MASADSSSEDSVEENIVVLDDDVENLNGNFSSEDCRQKNVAVPVKVPSKDKRPAEKPNVTELTKQIMPQHPDRLFAQILYTKNMDNVIFKWQNEFHLTKESAIHDLYQLYVDICTYQHINVKTFLEEQQNPLDELVPYMSNSRNSILSYTNKYFLSIRSQTHLRKVGKIEEFIEKFVAACFKEKLIYEDHLFRKLIAFFVSLCNSDKRPIRHTGVFLGTKHLTQLIVIGAKICRKISNTKNALESVEDPEIIDQFNTRLENLKKFDDQINSMICFLQSHIFQENVNYGEPRLYCMRLDLLTELYKWIEINPGRHLHDVNLKYFVKAIGDTHKNVRYKAIELVCKIIANYEPLVHSKLNKLMYPIAKQIEDVDCTVAILAVDTLTVMQNYITIPSSIREVIMKNIYNLHYPLAEACGRFLTELIKQKCKKDDYENQLKLLCMFECKAAKRGFLQRQPYLIEAIYNSFPVLQNIEAFMNFFKIMELDEEYKSIWLHLLTESVHMTFTGKCSEIRCKQQVMLINKEIQSKMQKDLLNSEDILKDNFAEKELLVLFRLLRDKMREEKNKTGNEQQTSSKTSRPKRKPSSKKKLSDDAVTVVEINESPKKKQKK